MEAAKLRSVKVRILMPAHELTEDIVEQLRQYYYHINVRYIEKLSGTKATFLVVDRKTSLIMELRDDTKSTFDEAIGLSTFSTSKSGVLSYVAIFENLWTQTELYNKLQDHERIEKEFINVAAHELKNPIQPILGLSQLLRSTERDRKEEVEYLDIIIRNAKRLQRLTEDILDVAKIESRSLLLQKERFNLNQLISNSVEDSKNQITKENKDQDIKILSPALETNSLFMDADKSRINQVISNLLSNAIKFTKEGTICITVEKREEHNGGHVAAIRIKDGGTGIDHKVLPRLFTKFTTTGSHSGTGLGLFISKSIVEAHGGRIWAENNTDGKGATFTFSLPI
jgi:signal transduction histidine kinase